MLDRVRTVGLLKHGVRPVSCLGPDPVNWSLTLISPLISPRAVGAFVSGSKIGWPSVATRVAMVSKIYWQSVSSGAALWVN